VRQKISANVSKAHLFWCQGGPVAMLALVFVSLAPGCRLHELLRLRRTFFVYGIFWEEFHCVAYSFGSEYVDVYFMASIVLHVCTDVPSRLFMWVPWWSVIQFVMGQYLISWL